MIFATLLQYIFMHENKPMTILYSRNTHVPMLLELKVLAHSNFKQGVCHIVALPFTIFKKSILRQKMNYGNSNISPCKNIIFKKSSKRNQNPSRYYYNSLTKLKF